MARKKKHNTDFTFDFSSLKFSGKTEELIEVPKLSYEPVAFENAEAMADAIDYGRDYFALVSGSFIFGDFIEALCLKKDLCPSVVYITTLGMGRDNIDSIVNLTDYLGCDRVKLLVSHYFASMERHGLMKYLYQEFEGRPIDVAVLQSHCKLALIYSDKGDVLIQGSANLSSSNNVEQFAIVHDPALIEFVRARLDNIMERFTVFSGQSGHTPHNNAGNTGRHAFEALMEGN